MTKFENWTGGQTANTSIGQGYVLASPVQMAEIAGAVANGGTCYQPTLIYQIQQPNGRIVRRSSRIQGDLFRDNGLRKEQVELVRRGMWEVVNAPGGTGKKGAVPGIEVAGKTGTAQFWRKGKKDDHSWFLAFAPYDHPKIALAVMVEGGNSGNGVAAPIASEIIQKSFALDHGYDPGLKPLHPAVGNYNLIESVSFKAGAATTRFVSGNKMTSDQRTADAGRRAEVPRAQIVAKDVASNASGHLITRQAEPIQGERRSFFSLFKTESEQRKSTQLLGEDKKKHHFLFFLGKRKHGGRLYS